MLAPDPRPLTGISLKVGSVVAFTVMAALIKYAGAVPAGETVFFRSFFAIFPILGYLAFTGKLRSALKTKNLAGHFWRGLVGVFAMGLGFYAIARLPLPDVTALGYASPLFVVLLSAIFLNEKVRIYRWSAVLFGLFGVIIILWPKLSIFGDSLNGNQAFGAAAAVGGALLAAVAMLLVRRLVSTEETQTIVLYFSLSASVLALFSLPFGWVALNTPQAIALIIAGMIGGVAQIMLTESYRHAEAAVLAPFEYASILFAIVIGFFIFSETPTIYTIMGSAVVVMSGVFIIWRERKLGLQRGQAKAAAPPQA